MIKLNIHQVRDLQIVDSLPQSIDWGLEAINVSQAWEKTKGEGVTIVTMDTGCDVTHPDLQGKIKSTFNFIQQNRDVTDEYGHGTHVAGLLVGEHTGVAPNAELHVVKVLDDNGRGNITHVLDGITHAMNLKADVLSISLGIPSEIPQILKQRIMDAYASGVTIVSAVGNRGVGQADNPARMKEVIGVGGIDQSLEKTDFSNGGYMILAPSTNILSTYKDNNYAYITGTSMASPLVAGSIALLISQHRKQGIELTPSEIQKMIKQNRKLDLTKVKWV